MQDTIRHKEGCIFCGKPKNHLPYYDERKTDSIYNWYCSYECARNNCTAYLNFFECKHCKKIFPFFDLYDHRIFPLYCSMECRLQHGTIPKKCVICEKPFMAYGKRDVTCSLKCRARHERNKWKGYTNNYRNQSPQNKFKTNIQSHFSQTINKFNLKDRTKFPHDLNILITHIEKQFTNKMTWENYTTLWVIDHKIPICAFNTLDEITNIAWDLNNIRPIEKMINRTKGFKYAVVNNEKYENFYTAIDVFKKLYIKKGVEL